jgi:hypothetical protein
MLLKFQLFTKFGSPLAANLPHKKRDPKNILRESARSRSRKLEVI